MLTATSKTTGITKNISVMYFIGDTLPRINLPSVSWVNPGFTYMLNGEILKPEQVQSYTQAECKQRPLTAYGHK